MGTPTCPFAGTRLGGSSAAVTCAAAASAFFRAAWAAFCLAYCEKPDEYCNADSDEAVLILQLALELNLIADD